MKPHSSPVRRNGQEGMTLIEVAMAAGVLLVVVVLLMGSLVNFNRTSEIVSSKTTATAHANSVLERLRQMDFRDMMGFQPLRMDGLGNSERVEAACVDATGNPVALPIEDAQVAARLPNPLEVSVSVTWRDKEGHQYRRRVSGLIGR